MQPVVAVRNGVLIASGQPVLPSWDAGLTLGDGLFETMRCDGGEVALLARHWRRMSDCAAVLQMVMPTLPQWSAATRIAIAAASTQSPSTCWRIKWLLTPDSTWIVLAFTLGQVAETLTLVTIDFPLAARRQPLMKTLSYADNLHAKRMAVAAGAEECVRLDHQGYVAEGAMVNLFAVVNNQVVTADTAGILPGIARGLVLELCASVYMAPWTHQARQQRLTTGQFLAASEWFASNALIGVCPVTSIDGILKSPGPLTTRLRSEYQRVTQSAPKAR